MKNAKRAGWEMMGWSLALLLADVLCTKVMVFVSAYAELVIACEIIFWVILVLFFLCLAYGFWGLACGYIPSVWRSYCEASDADIRRGIAEECRKSGTDVPDWMKE